MKQQLELITTGLNKKFGFETRTGADFSIQVNTQRELTDDQFLAALRRLKTIVETTELKSVDSNCPGDKYTECSWGLCSESKRLWPTPELHIWPYAFLNQGRVAPISLGKRLCPMDTRTEHDGQGCFYTCRIFQRKHKTPSREEALELITSHITKHKHANQNQTPTR